MLITLAGPETSVLHARVALAEVDLDVTDRSDHGLELEPDGAAIICDGPDVDVAVTAVSEYGWRLRRHGVELEDSPIAFKLPATLGGQG